MRRTKDPNDPKSGDGEPPSKPGGRARERLDQFNRQRGLPTDSDSKPKENDSNDTQKPPGEPKP
jgi:hypothetical protein